MPFNAKEHLIKLGVRDYLEVKWRLVWLREDHPLWGIETELLQFAEFAIVKAAVKDETGRVIATAHGMAKTGGKATWANREIEKAETAAIGRALAHAGIGTQFIDDETEGEGDHDHIADSPIERKQGNAQPKNLPPKPNTTPVTQQPLEGATPTFNAATGTDFLAWITAELDVSDVDATTALQHANGEPLTSITAWTHGYFAAAAAVLAFKMSYAGDKIAAFIGNVKRNQGAGFRNQAGGQFKPAELEQIRQLALKLVKGA
jgi:hypothetical protein